MTRLGTLYFGYVSRIFVGSDGPCLGDVDKCLRRADRILATLNILHLGFSLLSVSLRLFALSLLEVLAPTARATDFRR